MEQSQLVETFRSLSKTEIAALAKWVKSPFFNQRGDVARLFELLAEHFLSEKKASKKPAERGAARPFLDKKSVFEKIFGSPKSEKLAVKKTEIAFDDARLRHAMSFLFAQIKAFLAYQNWLENPANSNLALCQALKKRGLDSIFEKEMARARAVLEADAERSTAYLFHRHLFELEKWEFDRSKKRGGGEADLEAVGASFGAFVAAQVLRQGCAILAQSAVAAQADLAKIDFLEAVLAAAEAGKWADQPAVRLYFHGFQSLARPDGEAHFFELKRLLEAHSEAFPQTEARDLWMLAINFSIKKVNLGERDFARSAFELYRSGLDRRVLFEDGQLSPFTYKNALALGASLGEWAWSRQFLEDFRPFLPSAVRESAYRLNLASLFFRQKDYEKTLEILRTAEFRDPLHALDQRRMLLKIYFERGENAALDSLLQSFQTYLRRRGQTVGYHRESYVSLLKFVQKLLKIDRGDRAALEKFRREARAARFLAEREWLLSVAV